MLGVLPGKGTEVRAKVRKSDDPALFFLQLFHCEEEWVGAGGLGDLDSTAELSNSLSSVTASTFSIPIQDY